VQAKSEHMTAATLLLTNRARGQARQFGAAFRRRDGAGSALP
jgi:hypothetical protein